MGPDYLCACVCTYLQLLVEITSLPLAAGLSQCACRFPVAVVGTMTRRGSISVRRAFFPPLSRNRSLVTIVSADRADIITIFNVVLKCACVYVRIDNIFDERRE